VSDSFASALQAFTPEVLANLRGFLRRTPDFEGAERLSQEPLTHLLDAIEAHSSEVQETLTAAADLAELVFPSSASSVPARIRAILEVQRGVGRIQETYHRALAAQVGAGSWEQEAIEDMDLHVMRPSEHQVQFRQEGKVLADWWPSKGTTMSGGKRGPVCKTGDAVVAWLKSL